MLNLNKIINTWLFDLDNTVYSSDINLFDQIDKKMKLFISKYLNISEINAHKIQKSYYLKYGTTLKGLMVNYNIDPEAFLEFVHDIDLSKLKSSNKLANGLRKLSGNRIIFTNGSKCHANNILIKLKIRKYIDHIHDIADSNYIPKPNIRSYKLIIKKYNLTSKDTLMIDDIPKNLETAKKLGMKTILVASDDHPDKKIINFKNNYPYIDMKISNLEDFLNSKYI